MAHAQVEQAQRLSVLSKLTQHSRGTSKSAGDRDPVCGHTPESHERHVHVLRAEVRVVSVEQQQLGTASEALLCEFHTTRAGSLHAQSTSPFATLFT